jgi:hypothetical protein
VPRARTQNDRAWLAAEVTVELADKFREQARAEDRSAAAHLRYLIRNHLSNDEGTGNHPGPRVTTSGSGDARHGSQ